jgi:hypothetical protein
LVNCFLLGDYFVFLQHRKKYFIEQKIHIKMAPKTEKHTQAYLFKLSEIKGKSMDVCFAGQDISTDGGCLLSREIESQIGIISNFSNSIVDTRDSRYIDHELNTMLSQRIFQIACGYEDANDCDTLKEDAIIKICSNRLPYTEMALPSQPTISRLENSVTTRDLYRMSVAMVDDFINSYTEPPALIILDCDDTDNICHGGQQGSLFNDYYGDNCYMPLHIYEGLSGKLILSLLKEGRRSKSVEVFNIVQRLINHIMERWQNTLIIVRGDSHFCSKELMDWSYSKNKLSFITGITANSRLNELAKATIQSVEEVYKKTQKPQKAYHSFEYKAKSWEHSQRVIVKAEMSKKGLNVRFIVTDMREFRTKSLYEQGYCARGSMELRIKDHKLYLKSDRTSCSSFLANSFRLFLHSAAYILIHTLQKEVLGGTEFENATMKTIQLKILKVAAWVKELKTKIHIEFPQTYPYAHQIKNAYLMFQQIRT